MFNTMKWQFRLKSTEKGFDKVVFIPNAKITRLNKIADLNKSDSLDGGLMGGLQVFAYNTSSKLQKKKAAKYLAQFIRTKNPVFLELSGKHRRAAYHASIL